jgi:hypothetical protein
MTDFVADKAAAASSGKQYGEAAVPLPRLLVEHDELFCT